MKNVTNIGKIIKQTRLSLNITADCLSRKANISRATLSAIENGSTKCSLDNLLSILNVLGIDLSFNSKNDFMKKRKRATRLNTSSDKKINDFIILCIEQYAKSKNISSHIVYSKMLKKGVIEDFKNDCEDLHGMSTLYLNNYIDALL